MKKNRRPITVEDLWSMKRFGPPTVSPDGRWACVAMSSYSMERNEGSAQLWLFATDGSSRRQLTRGPKDGDPQWSPDGRWIAFTSRRPKADGEALDDDAQLHLIAVDGGEAMRLTDHATGVAALRWFPDSTRIAFVSWVWPGERGVEAQARRMQADRDDPVKAYVVEHNHYRYWDHWLPRGRVPHLHVATLPTTERSGPGRATGATAADDASAVRRSATSSTAPRSTCRRRSRTRAATTSAPTARRSRSRTTSTPIRGRRRSPTSC